mgnify:CR=1 FL=1
MNQQRQQIGCGAGDDCEHQRILDGDQENLIVEKQPDIVVGIHKRRPFEQVERGKAEHDRKQNRNNRKDKEENEKRCDHQVSDFMLLYLHHRPLEFRYISSNNSMLGRGGICHYYPPLTDDWGFLGQF